MLISFSQINRIIGSIGLLLLTACQHPSEECLSIAFTGDVLLDRGVRQQIQRGGVEDLFASVAPLFHQMDATVINLECPVTSVRSPLHKKYIFRAEPRWMEELVKAGISHAALANNHTMDQGRSGLTDTYQHLLSAGITPIGYGNTSSESCQPVVIKKGKIKVALFNSVTLPLENWVYLENDPGSLEGSNHRNINKMLVNQVLPTCQLQMGMTELAPGSVWNTMPAHVHSRRMEAYFYFEIPEDHAICHFMGEVGETRHVWMKGDQAVLSPEWSIHSAAATHNYTFIWGMGGENLDYGDQDFSLITDLK